MIVTAQATPATQKIVTRKPAQVLDLRPKVYLAAYQRRQADQLSVSRRWSALLTPST